MGYYNGFPIFELCIIDPGYLCLIFGHLVISNYFGMTEV